MQYNEIQCVKTIDMAKTALGLTFVIIVLIGKNKEDQKMNELIFEIKKLDTYEKNKLKECEVKELVKIKVEIIYTEINK